MGWSGSGSRAPPAGAIDCLRNGVSSYPCFLLTVLFGLTALPLVWVVRDSRCSPGVLHGSGTGRPGGFRWRGQEKKLGEDGPAVNSATVKAGVAATPWRVRGGV